MNKKFAFTLTEVLVTLSIIGVVSALTVPTLMNQYQRKAQAVQIRKSANEIMSAIDMLTTEEGKTTFKKTSVFTDVLPNNTAVDGIENLITQHLKVIKTCDKDETGCFASENYRSINNANSSAFTCDGTAYVLANSSAICVSRTIGEKEKYLTVQIDTNGIDKPNIGGRDMFVFDINENGDFRNSEIKCEGGSGGGSICSEDEITFSSATCIASELGSNCFGVLAENNWIMDY